MNHENKLQVLANIKAATANDDPKLKWLLVCHMLEAHEWQAVAKDASLGEQEITFRTLQQLSLWLESMPAPHIVIVDEYDPGIRDILRSMFLAIEAGKHRLFMARPYDMDQPKPQVIDETLDFMKR